MHHQRARRDISVVSAGQILLLALALALGGCSILGLGGGNDGSGGSSETGERTNSDPQGHYPQTAGGLGSSRGISLFGGGSSSSKGSGLGVGVNSYLWRASLDTLSFMPLASADPFGGVIITDWYAPAQSPSERFKVTVYILDKRLRADALKLSVFKQIRAANGDWADAAIDTETPSKIENAILTRARQLRIASSDK